jgi:predicted metal-binding protein
MTLYQNVSIPELEAKLSRLRSGYEDLEEVITFNLTHSSAHIGSGEVRRDEETLSDLRGQIASIEKRLAFLYADMSGVEKDIETDVLEYAVGGSVFLVERFRRLLPISDIEYFAETNLGCEACHKRGTNLACPPYSPLFHDHIGKASEARIICYRMPLEQVSSEISTDRHRTAHKILRKLVSVELLGQRKKGHTVAGSGPCQMCEECSVESGKRECRKPDLLIYSLESMGVNLMSLSERAFSLPLEWSDGTSVSGNVSAIGAVFY